MRVVFVCQDVKAFVDLERVCADYVHLVARKFVEGLRKVQGDSCFANTCLAR